MAESLGYACFEWAFVDELWGEEYAVSFCFGHGGDIVFDGSEVDCFIFIDDECVFAEDVVLIHVSGDEDGSLLVGLVFGVEEAVSDGSLPFELSVEKEVVFDWFEPLQIVVDERIDYVELAF